MRYKEICAHGTHVAGIIAGNDRIVPIYLTIDNNPTYFDEARL